MLSHGRFITIEGIEGVGKSTNLNVVRDYLTQCHMPVLVTREPGGTAIAEKIRQIFLEPIAEPLTPLSELLLLFASRAQHVSQVIEPTLATGTWVVCDRFTDASFAYQCAGRGLPRHYVNTLATWVHHTLTIDLTILLDMDVESALLRVKNRGALDRIEQEKLDFFERVRQGYLSQAQKEPARFCVIDAGLPPHVVVKQIQQRLDQLMQSLGKM